VGPEQGFGLLFGGDLGFGLGPLLGFSIYSDLGNGRVHFSELLVEFFLYLDEQGASGEQVFKGLHCGGLGCEV
jgi:hypothetical protein